MKYKFSNSTQINTKTKFRFPESYVLCYAKFCFLEFNFITI